MAISRLKEQQYVADTFLNAAKDGMLVVCERLLEDVVAYKPIAKIVDQQSEGNALHWAAYNGHVKIVRWLLKTFPDLLDLKTRNGSTALHNAITQGHLDIIKFLLLCGASCTVKNADGENAFSLAEKSDLDIKNHFKEYKAESDKRYQATLTSGDKDEVDKLITQGADSIVQAQEPLREVKKPSLFPQIRSPLNEDDLTKRFELLKAGSYFMPPPFSPKPAKDRSTEMIDMNIIRERFSIIKKNIDIVKNSGKTCVEAITKINDALHGFNFKEYTDIFDECVQNIEVFLSSKVDIVVNKHDLTAVEISLSSIANASDEIEREFNGRGIFPSQDYMKDWHKLFTALRAIISKEKEFLQPVKPSLTF